MNGFRVLVAGLIVVSAVGCGSSVSPAPSQVAVAQPSHGASAAAPSTSASPAPSVSVAPTPSPTATPVPTPTPSPTPAPTPVPWQRYSSKLFHYKMSYPPGWVVTPGSSRRSDQFDNYGYPYIYVSRDTVSTSVSISRTVSAVIATTKSHYRGRLVSNKAIKLAGGYVGRILVFTGIDNGLKVTIREIVVGKGRVGYFIDLFGDTKTAAADAAIYKRMYGTWRPT